MTPGGKAPILPPRSPSALRRRILRQALFGAAILLAFVAAGLYFTSPQFQEKVRFRVVGTLERITGGHVDLGSLQWNFSSLEFEARDLTIHGREAPGQKPYFHADRVLVRLKIVSVLRDQLAFRYLDVEHPVIHLISFADGTTNQPQPEVKPHTGENNVERLFRLAVQRVEIHNGE